MSTDDSGVPYGYCQCGCGQKTDIPKWSNARYGYVAGQPKRYIHGHNWRGKKRKAEQKALEQRFWEKVAVKSPEECWEWQAFCDKAGYGRIQEGGRGGGVLYAHRVAYELTKGPIPPELEIDHLCSNRKCVNPGHLEAVTHAVNVLRGQSPIAVHARECADSPGS